MLELPPIDDEYQTLTLGARSSQNGHISCFFPTRPGQTERDILPLWMMADGAERSRHGRKELTSQSAQGLSGEALNGSGEISGSIPE